jgi:glutamate/tyrosine decarboxylase-like PLP-dependent enzyme
MKSGDRLKEAGAAVRRAAVFGAEYLEGLSDRRVSPSPASIAGLSDFDEALPQRGDAMRTLDLLHRAGSPAATASAGGRFFGLVVGGSVPAALGARVLASTWDQIAFNDLTSPVAIKLEDVASRWILDIMGLPQSSSVGFCSGATMGNFTCLSAARHMLLQQRGWDVEKDGLFGAPPFQVIVSEQSHVTVKKALSMLGIGSARLVRVPCDDNGAMRADAIPEIDEGALVIAQAGNVNSGAIDPIEEISRRLAGKGAWLHVDGAFGLWAAASPKTAGLVRGIDAADSWVVDGHKWLNTPYDCGMAICRHPRAVLAAMSTQAAYLNTGERNQPKDMGPEFSRSARAAEVWAALHSLGRKGVAELVDRCCAHARRLAEGLSERGFVILNTVVLNQVVATVPGHEADMGQLAKAVQDSGTAWFGTTHWRGRDAIRLSVSSWVTDDRDIDLTVEAIGNAWDCLRQSE